MVMRNVLGLIALASLTFGCAADDPSDTGGSGGTDTGDTDGPMCEVEDAVMADAIDESGCTALATDYEPRVNMSADDMWPACVTDDGTYHLVDTPPSSIGRVEAYEFVADLLWRNGVPTVDDFTDARVKYAEDEGLESRLLRREDLHYPPIPEADWDPGVAPDKQCSVPENVDKYPDRCAGPAQIGPLVDAAFAAGQTGDGDPQVQAARIHAGFTWFLYLSAYKEANTCATAKAKDCDSAWAYYTGGMDRGAGVGFSAEVRAQSPNADERIFDGLSATRCWRDLYPEDMYPLLADVDQAGQDLFALASEQLDEALHRGYAVVLRERMERQGDLTGSEATANWEFLRVAGPVLDREAEQRDAANAQILADLWQMDCPTAADLEAGIAALDAIFPCP